MTRAGRAASRGPWSVAWRAGLAATAACGALGAFILTATAGAQVPLLSDARLAGLQWTFVRVRYYSTPEDVARTRRDFWSDPWAIDAPAAEQNLSRRLATVTAIRVNDPIVLPLDDPQIWEHPWLYFVEPGLMELREQDVDILREFLLRGGTATFDDFHGPIEWAHFEREIRKLFPDRPIVDLPPDHPIYHCFYSVAEYPQIPGLGSFFAGRTWEKGGFVARLRAVEDDSGRAMVLINWNTDMGDGWEWSNAEEYPGYLKYTTRSYLMMINEIIYALTH